MADTTVTVAGNCTGEPVTRFSAAGAAVVSFAVAVTARKRNEATGKWEDGDTSFFDVSCFGRLAENVAESVSKGKRIVVVGALKQSKWEKDGEKRSKIEIVADEVAVSLKWDALADSGGATPARAIVEEPF
jgi:single-strand DNA-binding protein